MAIASYVAITISVVSALCIVVIAAAIHRIVTTRNKGYDDNGIPQADTWVPNNYPPEQLERMAEIRWRNRKELWNVARDYRMENGMGLPDHYPGNQWSYDIEQQDSRPASRRLSFGDLYPPNMFEQIPIGSPHQIGYAYRNVPYLQEHGPELGEDKYGVPAGGVSSASSSGLPYMLKRWTQHGAPRLSQQVFAAEGQLPRIMLNDSDIPLHEYGSNSEMRAGPSSRLPQRSSSVYSKDTLRLVPSEPTEPAAAHLVSRWTEHLDGHPGPSQNAEMSRVQEMIAQWERAHGAY